ncbi:MAG: serine hydrolase [Anaerolineales bacterium]|nr:serine hydrolase [Anaerolineae bacterium]PWB49533.1 MAG: serine hydrolase [Anaerolineales bacterium]
MNKNLKLAIRIALGCAVALVGLFVIINGFIAIRYSPGYAYRELFMDLGTVYDYRVLPERKLIASSDPFQFAVDTSKESLVQQTFQANPAIADLDAFLADTGTQAFLVIQDDTVIYERYFMDLQRDSVVTSFSVAKSFDSALIGAAIQDGFIKSAEDSITDYIPELAKRDPRFSDIQIRHLLMMGSGLQYVDNRFLLPEDDNLTYGFDDLRHLALTEIKVQEQPGGTFLYNNYHPILLGLILERATGMPVTAYLQEKIWTPLGMEFGGSWSLDSEKSGFEKMESGINARAIDFAKFGRLYLNKGNWDGTQVVPADWVAVSTADNGLIKDAPIYYGYMWWGENCNPDSQDFLAMGNFGQYIYVSPDKGLIIVRNAESYGVESDDEAWVVWANAFCQFAKALP